MPEVKVWAPHAERVRLRVSEPGQMEQGPHWTYPMVPAGEGWFAVQAKEATEGRDYGFFLGGEEVLFADPRSRRQPEGVHGPSRFWSDRVPWRDAEWAGRSLEVAVLYELHVGTFTPEGTLDGAIDRLDHLVGLGVTHVELLPLNDFNGEWNWGYDGVLWYAVHEAYGGPDALHRFVEACHERGLAVVLDVVYNHLGMSGNCLPAFGPYLKPGTNTWGQLVNLDGESSRPVRDYILDNAVMWLSEFHLDGLRLDAVHALEDRSVPHLLAELSTRVAALEQQLGRPLSLIAESDLNDPVTYLERGRGGWGLDAQWDDDVHHSLHALLSGERQGYYGDFGTLAGLAKVWTGAFLHDGTYSSFRGRIHGKEVDPNTEGWRFVAYLQDHDQVGNRAAGDRLAVKVPMDLLKVGAVLLLTSPFTPMLFMGEEWAASTPWPFFTSHPEPELAAAVGKGRIEEFAEHDWDVSEMIDPQDPAAFQSAKLLWEERHEGSHGEMLAVYEELLRLRREHPELGAAPLAEVLVDFSEAARWLVVRRGALAVLVNLAEEEQLLAGSWSAPLFVTASAETVRDGTFLPPRAAAIVAER